MRPALLGELFVLDLVMDLQRGLHGAFSDATCNRGP